MTGPTHTKYWVGPGSPGPPGSTPMAKYIYPPERRNTEIRILHSNKSELQFDALDACSSTNFVLRMIIVRQNADTTDDRLA